MKPEGNTDDNNRLQQHQNQEHDPLTHIDVNATTVTLAGIFIGGILACAFLPDEEVTPKNSLVLTVLSVFGGVCGYVGYSLISFLTSFEIGISADDIYPVPKNQEVIGEVIGDESPAM